VRDASTERSIFKGQQVGFAGRHGLSGFLRDGRDLSGPFTLEGREISPKRLIDEQRAIQIRIAALGFLEKVKNFVRWLKGYRDSLCVFHIVVVLLGPTM
jgi:hypothetical protein